MGVPLGWYNFYGMPGKKSTYTVEEAKRKLESFCAYQERCHKETERKLQEMGMIPEARELILLHLMENNYLNEERFARSFARGRFRLKQWGKERIRRELGQRAVSANNIARGLEEIPGEDYLETMESLGRKKFESTKGEHPLKRKRKVADFLLRRGFESYLVYDFLQELDQK
jgi:regulatory protein